MTRRTALLLLFALTALPNTGCYHFCNFVARFRANHGCCVPFANPGCAPCGAPCGPCGGGMDGCATCFSGPQAPPMGQAYPGAIFGAPQPINQTAPDPKAGMPNPMKQ